MTKRVTRHALQALGFSVIITATIGYSLRARVSAKNTADFANSADVGGGSGVIDKAIGDGLHGYAGATGSEPVVRDAALAVSRRVNLPTVGLGGADTGISL